MEAPNREVRLSNERATAWGRELRIVHQRLRDALRIAREAVLAGAAPESLASDLQLFCRGFCVALAGHHASEDASLFPRVIEQHPEHRTVVAQLEQDHRMLAHLIRELEHALGSAPDETSLLRHLDGIGALMESHFRYEERRLVAVLDAISDDSLDRTTLFGPIG